MTITHNTSRRFLRLKEVQQIVGLGHATIYERISEGLFPAPYSLGARAVAWLSDEIDAWIEARIRANKSRSIPMDKNDRFISERPSSRGAAVTSSSGRSTPDAVDE